MPFQFPTTCADSRNQSAVLVPEKNKVVVIGGRGEDGHALDVTNILDLATGEWFVGPQLNMPRYNLTAVYCQSRSRIYAIGGSTNHWGDAKLDCIEILDFGKSIELNSGWRTLSSPYVLQSPRCVHASLLVEDRFLVVLGGWTDTPETDPVEIFDLNPPRGAETAVWHTGPVMTRKRAYFGAAVVQGNKIVVGGEYEDDQFDFIEFNANAATVYDLFPEGSHWKTHPRLKATVSASTNLFSLDPQANAFLVMGSGGLEMVDLESAKVVPIPQCSFSVDRGHCAAVLLPAGEPSHACGLLAIGGLDNPFSMEWLPLPDDAHFQLSRYRNDKMPDFLPLPPKPSVSGNPELLKSSLLQWVKDAESILKGYLARVAQWKDQEEVFFQHQCDKLQKEIVQLIAKKDSREAVSAERADNYVRRCNREIASIRGVIKSLAGGQNVANSLAALPEDGPPHALCCPITFQLMTDPVVIVESGHTYERAAIAHHWATQENLEIPVTCPNTNQQLDSTHLTPNLLARSQIHQWREQHPDWHP